MKLFVALICLYLGNSFQLIKYSTTNLKTYTDPNKLKNSRLVLSMVSAPNILSYSNLNSTSTTEIPVAVDDSSSNLKPPKTPRPIFGLVRFLALVAAVSKVLYMRLTSTSPVNNLPSRTRKPNNFKKLVSTVRTRISSRRFWFQLFLASVSIYTLREISLILKSMVTEISFSSFLKLINTSPASIQNLRVSPTSLSFSIQGRAFVSRTVSVSPVILERLLASGVEFCAAVPPVNIFGLLWTLGYCYFLWRLNSRAMGGPPDEGVGKRKDGLVGSDGSGALNEYGRLSFDDVAGQDKAKQEVAEICQMLRNPEAYSRVGARLPAGILLVGPPGTGKTLLARVTAAEANVPFYSCAASDFVEVFVGRGPARVRKLFKTAAENAPCIVFIDELDSLGRSRRAGSMNSEQESTLNQLLTAMDGLDTSNNGVIVMAATNRAELLDPALLRAGRFDRIVQCPLPDKLGRLAILGVHSRRLRLAKDVDLEKVARFTPGTCGADLSTIVNEAAIRTARRAGTEVSAADFDDALRTFFSGRGVSVSGLKEMMEVPMPSWLKQLTGGLGSTEPQAGFNG